QDAKDIKSKNPFLDEKPLSPSLLLKKKLYSSSPTPLFKKNNNAPAFQVDYPVSSLPLQHSILTHLPPQFYDPSTNIMETPTVARTSMYTPTDPSIIVNTTFTTTATGEVEELIPFEILSKLQEYCKKPTISKYDFAYSHVLELSPTSRIRSEFNNEEWTVMCNDRPNDVNIKYFTEINSIINHLFGKKKILTVQEARNNWMELRGMKVPNDIANYSFNKDNWKSILFWVEDVLGTYLSAFESQINPIQQYNISEGEWFGDYVVKLFKGALRLNNFCQANSGEITVISSSKRKNEKINILEETAQRGHMADFLCSFGSNEVVAGLSCGSPHLYDPTKKEMDMYHLSRLLKDMLDENLAQAEVEGGHKAKLYTIGIRQFQKIVRIYIMEKRDVYRLHLLKQFSLPTTAADYAKLRIAICWAWNIRCMVRKLWIDSSKEICASPIRIEVTNQQYIETPNTPEKQPKRKTIKKND
ncbi:7103_t:CDS:2, partial [Entrophospora sp. SA101]